MKQFKYIFSSLALLTVIVVWAQSNFPSETKIKPKSILATEIPASKRIGPARMKANSEGLITDFRCTEIKNKTLKFAWSNPEQGDGFFEDFETHQSFKINSAGELGWTYRDMDNEYTYSFSQTVFPNAGSKMAYLIYDPSQTTPVGNNPNLTAFSGDKFLACFSAYPAPNNDWIISPALDFHNEFQLSFRAKTFDSQYDKERIRVGYSTSGTMPSDFTIVSAQPYDQVPTIWTLMSYKIPAEAKYVAINCVSNDAFLLMIDDIYVGSNIVRPRAADTKKIQGFNIYRNQQKINPKLIENLFYTDEVPTYQTYQYYIETVYGDQTTALSNTIDVEVPDIRNLPFIENFDSWSLDTHYWTKDPSEGSMWDVDYYEVGLANPSARYNMSRLTNYSQSLVSKELRSTDLSNIWIRFDYMFVDYIYKQENTLEQLSIEISDDNEQTWKQVKNFTSESGLTNWIRISADISSLVNNPLFKIRLRAHGVNAYNMMRWFVDNIKVWNPKWSAASLVITQKGAPVAGAKVALSTKDGDTFSYTSDLSGKVALPHFEANKYQLQITGSGFNDYSSEWEILPHEENTLNISLTQPVLNTNTTSIVANIKKEDQQQHSFTLSNDGDGPVDFHLTIDYPKLSGSIHNRFKQLRSFDASGDVQSSIVFDGEHYYTSSYFIYATFYKYDKTGKYIEEFTIPNLYQPIYDMAFDGTYTYGSNGLNTIFQLDLKNRRVVKKFSILEKPDLKITHCSYDPSTGRLWIGDPHTLFSIDMNGVIKSPVRTFHATESPVVFGSAYDNLSPGGPYLWLASQVPATTGENKIDCITLRQWKIATNSLTNVTHLLTNLEGLKPGTLNYPSFIAGLETSVDLSQGKLTLIGLLQQSPSRIFALELCELNNWLQYTPVDGTLSAGESRKIEVNIDALQAQTGISYGYNITAKTNPLIPAPSIATNMILQGASQQPRPIEVTAIAEGSSAARLSWNKSTDAVIAPTGYNIYRNKIRLNATPIEQTSFLDENLLRGDYVYTVTALYGATESRASESASVFIKIGAPCFPPISLSAQVKLNKDVHLEWKSPDQTGNVPAVIRWDNAMSKETLGLEEGGLMFAGAKWNYEEILPYRGMEITEVEIYINDLLQDLKIIIFRDGETVSQTAVTRTEIEYGAFNVVKLTTPVVIEPGYDYTIAARVVHQAGYRPIGMDNAPTKIGKGDLISTDGKIWNSLYRISNLEGNINIACKLEPSLRDKNFRQPVILLSEQIENASRGTFKKGLSKKTTQTSAPGSKLTTSAVTLSGYKVYRDGVAVAEVSATEYVDQNITPGRHWYQIASVYNVGQSALSPSTEIQIAEIPGYYPPAGLKGEVILNKKIELAWLYPSSENREDQAKGIVAADNEPDRYALSATSKSVQESTLSIQPPYYMNFGMVAAAESGITSDSSYIYTCLRQQNGRINKYTLDGEFVETFAIANVPPLIDLTYDGTYFYAGAGGSSNIIYQMDFTKRELVSSFAVSEIVRHIAFIPELDNGRGGFEVGDWLSSIYISLNGAKLGDGPTYKAAYGTTYHKGKIYAFEQGGANRTIVGIFDRETKNRVGEIDLSKYEKEFSLPSNASAGGAGIITTPLGGVFLALNVQQTPANRVYLLELEPPTGVVGYNIYCNNQQVNTTPVTERKFSQEQTEPGIYRYAVETVYMDQTVSTKSNPVNMVIEEITGVCATPVDVKAIGNSYGYNIEVSWVDPHAHTATHSEDAEGLLPFGPPTGSTWTTLNANGAISSLWPDHTMPQEGKANGWFVLRPSAVSPPMAIAPLSGQQLFCSMPAQNGATSNWLISPALSLNEPFLFNFYIRNGSDQLGKAQYRIMYSLGSNHPADFLPLETFYAQEQWEMKNIEFGSKVKYVAIQHIGGAPLLVDLVSVDLARLQNRIFGYDVFRGGVKLNTHPLKGSSYIDFNLLPADYSYQVRAVYTSSCESPLSAPYPYTLSYNRACQAPEKLRVAKKSTGVEMEWSAPAIGKPQYIGWHSGKNQDAIGVPGGGSFYAAVKFLPLEMLSLKGLMLSQIELFLQSTPNVMFIIVYQNGKQIYQQEVMEFVYDKFWTIYLDQPIAIDTEKELMVALYFEHSETSIPMGVDQGPAFNGKGDLYSSDGISFRSMKDVGDYNINWNITLGLSPYSAIQPQQPTPVKGIDTGSVISSFAGTTGQKGSLESKKSRSIQESLTNIFMGYKVYRNQQLLTQQPIFDLNYLDASEPDFGANNYQVGSLYSQCGEALSEIETIVYLPNSLSDPTAEEILIEPSVVKTSFSVVNAPQGSQIDLFHGDGRKALTTTDTRIDISGLQPGAYYVRILKEGQLISTQKLIKIQ